MLNEDIVRALRIPQDLIERVAAAEQRELERRERTYRGNSPVPEVRGCTVILVDDGLATGSTMRAALAALRRQGPARVVVAVPIGATETCAEFQREADVVVCAVTPEPFYAVDAWYGDFSQTSDEEVHDLLERSAEPNTPAHQTARRRAGARPPGDTPA